MTWTLAHELLQLATALLAIATRHARIAALLFAGLACDLVTRAAQALATRLPGLHYAGVDRIVFHASQAAWLAWPCLALAFVLATLARTTPAVGLWAVAVTFAVVAYPQLDPDAASPAFLVTLGVCVAASLGAIAWWVCRSRDRGADQAIAVVLALGELVVLAVLVSMRGLSSPAEIAERWAIVAPSRFVVWLAIGVVLSTTWIRARPTRYSRSSRSPQRRTS